LQSKAQASHQPEQAPDRVSGEKGRTIGQLVPRDFWLADSEKKATIDFHGRNPLEEYRRLTFMMIDQCMISGLPVEVCFANIVAVSPSSVWRVLPQAGLSSKWQGQPSKKGSGFEQPLKPMNIGISTFATSNIGGTFLLPVQRARWLLERS
jgi:putative transposase